jgi:DNA polymerase-1
MFKINPETSALGYAIGCKPGGSDGKEAFLDVEDSSLSNLYTCKQHNIEKQIKSMEPKVILVEGRALKTISGDANLEARYFYNYKQFDSHFYSPEFNAWIVPIPATYKWIGEVGEGRSKRVAALNNFHYHFVKHQLAVAHVLLDTPFTRKSIVKSTYVEDPNQFLRDNMDKKVFSYDLETTGLKYYRDKIFCILLAFDGDEGFYLDWDKVDTDLLSKFFEGKFTITANGKFDLEFLLHNKVKAHVSYDVNYAFFMANSNRSSGLKDSTYYHTQFGGYDDELDHIKRVFKTDNYDDIPKSVMLKYACMDAAMTFRLWPISKSYLNERQYKFFIEEYIPLANLFARVEMRGIQIDKDYLLKLKSEKEIELRDIEKRLHELLYRRIELAKEANFFSKRESKSDFKNLNIDKVTSTASIRLIFFEVLKVPKKGAMKTDSGVESVAETALKTWATSEIPVVKETAELLLRHRTVSKLVTNYLSEGLKKNSSQTIDDSLLFNDDENSPFMEPDIRLQKKRQTSILQNLDDDGVLHASFNFQLVRTFRLSGSNPNLQNIPIKKAPYIRPIFKARPGHKIAECDYDGFHFRIMAMFANDNTLTKLFKEGSPKKDRNLHSKTAASVFTPYSYEEFTKIYKDTKHPEHESIGNYRQLSKIVNFGFLYGRAAISFARDSLMVPGGWEYKKAVEFFHDRNLSFGLDPRVEQQYNAKKIDEREAIYYTCATYIRNQFFAEYNGVWDWLKEQKKRVKECGYVESLFGVKTYFPELTFNKFEGENLHLSNLENDSVNYPILISEANIMQKAQNRLDKHFREYYPDVHMLNQVHDSVLIEFPDKYIGSSLGQEIHDIMVQPFPEYNGIVLDAAAEYSNYWGGSYGIEDAPKEDALVDWFS